MYVYHVPFSIPSFFLVDIIIYLFICLFMLIPLFETSPTFLFPYYSFFFLIYRHINSHTVDFSWFNHIQILTYDTSVCFHFLPPFPSLFSNYYFSFLPFSSLFFSFSLFFFFLFLFFISFPSLFHHPSSSSSSSSSFFLSFFLICYISWWFHLFYVIA